MAQLFFCDELDECGAYDKSTIIEWMKENDIKPNEVQVFKAKRITGEGFFFCTEFFEPGEVSQSDCGKLCDKYKPRNGKNGRCIHSGYCYEKGEKVTFINAEIAL